MRVAVRKLEGVEDVEVSLNRGLALITLRPDNRITIEQVREAIRSKGFTPKGAQVRIQGRVVEQDGKLGLVVPGRDRPYLLADEPEHAGAIPRIRAAALGRTVVIDGTVPESPKRGAAVDTVRVRSFAVTPGR